MPLLRAIATHDAILIHFFLPLRFAAFRRHITLYYFSSYAIINNIIIARHTLLLLFHCHWYTWLVNSFSLLQDDDWPLPLSLIDAISPILIRLAIDVAFATLAIDDADRHWFRHRLMASLRLIAIAITPLSLIIHCFSLIYWLILILHIKASLRFIAFATWPIRIDTPHTLPHMAIDCRLYCSITMLSLIRCHYFAGHWGRCRLRWYITIISWYCHTRYTACNSLRHKAIAILPASWLAGCQLLIVSQLPRYVD